MRRRQNNPISPAGRANRRRRRFALRTCAYCRRLKDVTLRVLDIGLLQAGASMRRVREPVAPSHRRASVAVAYHFVHRRGAHADRGGRRRRHRRCREPAQPALARGTLRTVAATTWAEYKKYWRRTMLTRRFQVVQADDHRKSARFDDARVPPPWRNTTACKCSINRGERAIFAPLYSCAPTPTMVSLLDTACARVAVISTPCRRVDDSRRRVDGLEAALEIIGRDCDRARHRRTATGGGCETRRRAARLAQLEERWDKEKTLVEASPACAPLRVAPRRSSTRSQLEKTLRPRPPPQGRRKTVARRALPLARPSAWTCCNNSLHSSVSSKVAGRDAAHTAASAPTPWLRWSPIDRDSSRSDDAEQLTVFKLDHIDRRVIGQRHALG